MKGTANSMLLLRSPFGVAAGQQFTFVEEPEFHHGVFLYRVASADVRPSIGRLYDHESRE
jgi:hypothetical protein